MLGVSLIGPVTVCIAHPGGHHDIGLLTERLVESPCRADLLVRRSNLYRHVGDISAALRDSGKALSCSPGETAAWLAHGLNLHAAGKDLSAEVILTRFIDSGGAHIDAYLCRARIRESLGRRGAAIDDLTDALRLSADPDLYLLRGQWQEMEGDLEAAEHGYREGLARCGGAVVIVRALVSVLARQGRFDDAMTLVEPSIAAARVPTKWLLLKAELLGKAGRTEERSRVLETALSAARDAVSHRGSRQNLQLQVEVLEEMGRREEADRMLQWMRSQGLDRSALDDGHEHRPQSRREGS